MWQRVRQFWRQEDGVAALEFALIAPVLLILLIGLTNVAFRSYEQARLNQATRETAEAAMFTRDIPTLSAVLTDQLARLGHSIGGRPYSGAVSLVCQCYQTGSSGACAATCSGGLPSGISVKIETSLRYRPLFPMIGSEETLSSQLLVQVR